ncbi:MAG TPA: PhaM family polyhydroxyalkanoate granule multifunctional regulatory protein [Usitatibacter sp.]|nr:PhaM family polyhydroxyalkanoate granule multifunctional regulatory protein [Usitatibacter sp.]
MSKPVTTQEMFDLWTKMVNPGAYPLQSLMFPVLDPKELEKKIAELQTVEHWLKANLNMLQLTVKSLEYQRAMLKGGEKFQQSMREGQAAPAPGEGAQQAPNPAMWAWDMMAKAGQEAMDTAAAAPARPKRKPAKKRRAG